MMTTTSSTKLRRCENCGMVAPGKKCFGCKTVYYCGKECQTKDWHSHEPFCKKNNLRKDKKFKAVDEDTTTADIRTNTAISRHFAKDCIHCRLCGEETQFKLRRTTSGVVCIACTTDSRVPIDPVVNLSVRFEQERERVVGKTPGVSTPQAISTWSIANLQFLFTYNMSAFTPIAHQHIGPSGAVKLNLLQLINRHMTATIHVARTAGVVDAVLTIVVDWMKKHGANINQPTVEILEWCRLRSENNK
jgi:hypothetical protein